MSDDHDEHPQASRIRERAYLIWEKDGRPDGHALAHWVRARAEIEHEDAQAAGESASPASPAGGKPSS